MGKFGRAGRKEGQTETVDVGMVTARTHQACIFSSEKKSSAPSLKFTAWKIIFSLLFHVSNIEGARMAWEMLLIWRNGKK